MFVRPAKDPHTSVTKGKKSRVEVRDLRNIVHGRVRLVRQPFTLILFDFFLVYFPCHPRAQFFLWDLGPNFS